MWVLRLLHTSRVTLRRSLSLLAAPLVLANLLTIFLAPNTFAADAIWQGTELRYEDNVYKKVSAPPNRSNTPNEYEWRDTSANPDTAQVLYFGDNPTSSKSATLVVYEVRGDSYGNASSPKQIKVTRDLLDDAEGSTQTDAGTTCNTGGGLGWIICPVANYLAEGVDWVYGLIENFLEVQTIRNNDNGVYQLWQVFRTLANVCFILVFIAIIYSQLTGAGYSNYNIKTMMPRLVIGAVLVNISFLICSLAVDASNLLGYSIQSIFVSIRETLPTNADVSGDGIGWGALTALIIGGSAAAGVAGLATATAFSGGAMSFLLIAILIPIGMAILVAFTILAARQAIVVVLTIISPLAFVAFILPGTNSWFDRWRKSFTTMLIFFPMFALLFGGSQLAGTAIINTTPSVQDSMKIPMILIGLGAMAAPLVLTPFLIRFSGGILGQIANITNNKGRGLADRAKNWANDNADMHKVRKLSGLAERRENRLDKLQQRIDNGEEVGRWSQRRARRTPLPLRMDQKKRQRDEHKKQSESVLAAHHERDWQRNLAEPTAPNRLQSSLGMRSLSERTSDQSHLAHHLHNQAEGEKAANDARHQLGWQRHLELDREGRDRSLFNQTHQDVQQADQYKEIVEGETKADWERISMENSALKGLRLRAASQSDKSKLGEQEYNLLIENIRAKGADGTAIDSSHEASAQELQEIFRRNQELGSAQEVAKSIQQVDFAKSIERNAADLARATGIGDDNDAARVLARAKSTVSTAFVNDAKNIKDTMPYDLATNPARLKAEFEASSDMPIAKRLATIWASAANGNFGYESSREMIKWYSEHGGSSGGAPSADELRDFKELVKVDSAIGGGDRALELYLNDGNHTKTLDEWMKDMGTWNIKTSRFVEMGETRQLEAIRLWKSTSDPRGIEMFNRVRADILRTPTLNSGLKSAAKAELGIDSD